MACSRGLFWDRYYSSCILMIYLDPLHFVLHYTLIILIFAYLIKIMTICSMWWDNSLRSNKLSITPNQHLHSQNICKNNRKSSEICSFQIKINDSCTFNEKVVQRKSCAFRWREPNPVLRLRGRTKYILAQVNWDILLYCRTKFVTKNINGVSYWKTAEGRTKGTWESHAAKQWFRTNGPVSAVVENHGSSQL